MVGKFLGSIRKMFVKIILIHLNMIREDSGETETENT